MTYIYLVFYLSLQHLSSEEHRTFVRDKSNYESLDALIGKIPSTVEFLQTVLMKHCVQKQKDVVGYLVFITYKILGKGFKNRAVYQCNFLYNYTILTPKLRFTLVLKVFGFVFHKNQVLKISSNYQSRLLINNCVYHNKLN